MHIVFDSKDAEALKKSFELDEELNDEVLILNDDYSIGPLQSVEGETPTRNEWMAAVDPKENEEKDLLENRIKSAFEEDKDVKAWIWIAPNNRDVCGYYHLIQTLKNYQGKVFAIWLNNLPFINAKGQIFYPEYLSQIPAKEFVKAKKLVQEISPAVFETDPDEWEKICRENKNLRLLEGAKKVSSVDDQFFDKDLLGVTATNWQKASKTIQMFLEKSKFTVNESYLYWRLRELINEEKIEGQGDWPASKNFEVKKKGGDKPE